MSYAAPEPPDGLHLFGVPDLLFEPDLVFFEADALGDVLHGEDDDAPGIVLLGVDIGLQQNIEPAAIEGVLSAFEREAFSFLPDSLQAE